MYYDLYESEGLKPYYRRTGLRRALMTTGVAVAGLLSAAAQSDDDELFELGYGKRRRSEMTSAVAVVTARDFTGNRMGSIRTGSLGRVTGLKVVHGSGLPNIFGMNFDLRGAGAPLIVIDGVPQDAGASAPDECEVEAISVLKDASAAVYGSRAVNGVVLISTRRGRGVGKPTFEYSGHAGGQELLLNAEPMNAVQYLRMYNERDFDNGRLSVPYGEDLIAEYANGLRASTDWLGTALRNKPLNQNHSFSVGGSSGRFDYFAAAGYRSKDGWLGNDDFYSRRLSLRSNVSARIAENLRAGVSLSFINDVCRRQPENEMNIIVESVFRAAPVYMAYVDGDPNFPAALPNAVNPAALISSEVGGYSLGKERATDASVSLDYSLPFVDGLSVGGMYAFNYTEDEVNTFRRGYVLYGDDKRVASGNALSRIARLWAGRERRLLRLSASFERSFDGRHSVDAMLAWEECNREGDNFGAGRRTAMQTIDMLFAGTAEGQTVTQETGLFDPHGAGGSVAREGLFRYADNALAGRAGWSYSGKYMVDFAFRYDGSSRFSPERRRVFYPSLSAGWNVAREDFIRNSSLEFIDLLKLRVSWGRVGNEESSNYRFVSGYDYGTSGGYMLGDVYVPAVSHRNTPSSTTAREIASTTDLGIDAGLWNGGLNVVVDLYERRRSGMPSNSATDNTNGDLMRGAELTVSRVGRAATIGYNVFAGVSIVDVRKLHIEESAANDSYDLWRNKSSDRPANIVWGLNQTGQYQSFDEIFKSGIVYDRAGNAWMLPGDFIYGDWNGDGVIDDHDDHPIYRNGGDDGTKSMLDYHFGFGIEWRGFDLNLLFRGAGMLRRSFAGQYRGVGESNYNGFAEFYDRWHRADETNHSKWQEWIPGKYPSAYLGIVNRSFVTAVSDYWARDASWLRLRNLELGYSFSGTILKKVGVELLRVFVSSYNTFTWTSMPLGDPEAEDMYSYPASRTFSIGLNVKF